MKSPTQINEHNGGNEVTFEALQDAIEALTRDMRPEDTQLSMYLFHLIGEIITTDFDKEPSELRICYSKDAMRADSIGMVSGFATGAKVYEAVKELRGLLQRELDDEGGNNENNLSEWDFKGEWVVAGRINGDLPFIVTVIGAGVLDNYSSRITIAIGASDTRELYGRVIKPQIDSSIERLQSMSQSLASISVGES